MEGWRYAVETLYVTRHKKINRKYREEWKRSVDALCDTRDERDG